MSWERETIINFAEQVDEADIYTHSEKWINHIENKLGIKPYAENSDGAKSYKIPKKMIKLPRARRVMSEEQRLAFADRLVKARASRGITEEDDDNDTDEEE